MLYVPGISIIARSLVVFLARFFPNNVEHDTVPILEKIRVGNIFAAEKRLPAFPHSLQHISILLDLQHRVNHGDHEMGGEHEQPRPPREDLHYHEIIGQGRGFRYKNAQFVTGNWHGELNLSGQVILDEELIEGNVRETVHQVSNCTEERAVLLPTESILRLDQGTGHVHHFANLVEILEVQTEITPVLNGDRARLEDGYFQRVSLEVDHLLLEKIGNVGYIRPVDQQETSLLARFIAIPVAISATNAIPGAKPVVIERIVSDHFIAGEQKQLVHPSHPPKPLERPLAESFPLEQADRWSTLFTKYVEILRMPERDQVGRAEDIFQMVHVREQEQHAVFSFYRSIITPSVLVFERYYMLQGNQFGGHVQIDQHPSWDGVERVTFQVVIVEHHGQRLRVAGPRPFFQERVQVGIAVRWFVRFG